MVGRKTRLVLGGTFGLLVAFAANSALGAIILADPFLGFGGAQGDCLPRAAGELSASIGDGGDIDGMTPAAPGRSVPSPEQDNPLTLQRLEGLAAAGAAAGQPSSVSQGGANGPNNAAMTSVLFTLADPPFRTGIPPEATTAMPTGPPFELLRPPRHLRF